MPGWFVFAAAPSHIGLDRVDLAVNRDELVCQGVEASPDTIGELSLGIADPLDQPAVVLRARRSQDAKLSHVTPDRVNQHHPLAGEKLMCPLDHPKRLLFLAFHRSRGNALTRRGLADRRCIRGVVLLPQDMRLDVLRRQ